MADAWAESADNFGGLVNLYYLMAGEKADCGEIGHLLVTVGEALRPKIEMVDRYFRKGGAE